ncbi:restriction endonuclease [Steroidobacter sp. S1-65]|uniref:Restriction endonuclease n=1 Tax=Steroidobacter gossypii TaxID=2805490 RepID=A0ABS1WZT4_9GAMM|nr:restriction endonuclease [Steroidobacter gossypii]MBM0106494.1 restriction endonuclease [Steroidobacter gossypii]
MIPDYQALMLPVLRFAKDRPIQAKEVIQGLADEIGLTAEEREQLLPSGRHRMFDNRVHWAKTYLKQAGLLSYPRRGFLVATEAGQKVLSQRIDRIDVTFLKGFEAFRAFLERRRADQDDLALAPEPIAASAATPDETLRLAHAQINSALGAELLERVRNASSEFFEHVIIALLSAMGYGGVSPSATQVLGRTGDDGVDGVVNQDALGVDRIYVQAKRYGRRNSISAGDIRDFFGALNLKKAHKGIFFTTSSFSPSAMQTASGLSVRIVLIDGEQLSNLMIQYGVGCRTEETLHLKKIDDDFFEDI